MYGVGVDIGGTKIAGGVVADDGNVVRRMEVPTNASEGGQAIMARALDMIERLLDGVDIPVAGIGVASGGQADPKTGVVFSATPLIPGWVGMPIKSMVEERFGLPTVVVNDASAAAVGEASYGAGRGFDDFVMLTLGTGVGGGIYSDGRLLEGALGASGAIGHIVIDCDGRDCNCGGRGCLEMYTSGTAITTRALEMAAQMGLDTELTQAIRADRSSGTRLLGEAARAGDEFALGLIREAGEYLGWGLVSLANLLNPALFVVGGSVAELGRLLFDPAEEVLRKYSLRKELDPVSIVKAELGNDAGFIGAATLVWTRREHGGGK